LIDDRNAGPILFLENRRKGRRNPERLSQLRVPMTITDDYRRCPEGSQQFGIDPTPLNFSGLDARCTLAINRLLEAACRSTPHQRRLWKTKLTGR
jgi:hypothetical protein